MITVDRRSVCLVESTAPVEAILIALAATMVSRNTQKDEQTIVNRASNKYIEIYCYSYVDRLFLCASSEAYSYAHFP